MVPTKTAAEWSSGANAFINSLPPGVTTATCTCGGGADWSAPVLSFTLNNPTPAANDSFGGSVAVDGNTVVVGAISDDTGATDAGSAYIYNATTGALIATLNNPTPAATDYFGGSVAVDGNTAVIGANLDNTGATDAGSAYIYDAITGALIRTVNNPTPAVGDYFGSSVAVDGNTVVVGARQDDTGATDAGSAYIYNATTGALIATLNNPAPTAYDYFGTSVAVDGNTVVVGAYGDDTGASGAGSVYIYNATTGALIQTLNNTMPSSSFGWEVSVDANTILVGAGGDATGGFSSGSAYIYNATTGALVRKINNPTPGVFDLFGRYAKVVGSTMVFGVPTDSNGGVYIYTGSGGGVCTSCAP